MVPVIVVVVPVIVVVVPVVVVVVPVVVVSPTHPFLFSGVGHAYCPTRPKPMPPVPSTMAGDAIAPTTACSDRPVATLNLL